TLAVIGLIGAFALLVRPNAGPGEVHGPPPDSFDYAFGAVSLLHGQYVVDWDGTPHIPRYPPGFSLILAPAVAVGGVAAANWVPYAAAIVVGVLSATLAARLGGPLAAPLAALTTLYALGPAVLSRAVMSELPTAALTLFELLLISVGRG